jgi:hypothetical protein
MREYELVIDEALKNGLSPLDRPQFNLQLLYKVLGFRCGKVGLEAYQLLDNPLEGSVDMHYSWPFPQMITGELYNILVIRDDFTEHDKVYTVSDDHSTITEIFDIAALIYGKGTLMEVADFGEYAFMTNGVIMIYWDPTLVTWVGVTSHTNIPLMRTICNFKGQLIGGNVVNTWHDCDETFYVWSKIGEIDCTPDQKNTAGYKRCPYGGEVMHVRRLDDYAIGYSDKGITIISPVSVPAPTFGFKEMYDKGIINRGAIDGSLSEHLFVDEEFNLVKISAGKPPEMLGYQYYIEDLSSEDIIIKRDPKQGDYYIGNSSRTFLLSPNGLTEVQQHPSAIWRRGKESYALPDTPDSIEPEIITGIFNMGFAGEKTTVSIESDAILHTEPQAGVDWAMDLNTWGYGDYVPINNMGIGSVTTAANFFRFKMKFSTIYESFVLSYLKIRYKMTDLRGIRGVYAPPPRGQV